MTGRMSTSQLPQGRTQQRRDLLLVAGFAFDCLDRVVGLSGRPPEADQGVMHLRGRLIASGSSGPRRRGAGRGTDLVAKFQDDALGALLADSGDLHQSGEISAADGPAPPGK